MQEVIIVTRARSGAESRTKMLVSIQPPLNVDQLNLLTLLATAAIQGDSLKWSGAFLQTLSLKKTTTDEIKQQDLHAALLSSLETFSTTPTTSVTVALQMAAVFALEPGNEESDVQLTDIVLQSLRWHLRQKQRQEANPIEFYKPNMGIATNALAVFGGILERLDMSAHGDKQRLEHSSDSENSSLPFSASFVAALSDAMPLLTKILISSAPPETPLTIQTSLVNFVAVRTLQESYKLDMYGFSITLTNAATDDQAASDICAVYLSNRFGSANSQDFHSSYIVMTRLHPVSINDDDLRYWSKKSASFAAPNSAGAASVRSQGEFSNSASNRRRLFAFEPKDSHSHGDILFPVLPDVLLRGPKPVCISFAQDTTNGTNWKEQKDCQTSAPVEKTGISGAFLGHRYITRYCTL